MRAILQAALELFGDLGYDGTSTRMIANKAGVNISAIGYYFGGKEGLYFSVMLNIRDESYEYLKEVFEYRDKFSLKSKMTKLEALKLLDIITNSLVKMFVESDKSRNWARLIIREQSSPSKAFDILYEKNIKPLQEIYCDIVATNLGLRSNNVEVKIISHALFGQILSFCVSRESLLRLLGVKTLSANHNKIIKKILIRNSRLILRK